METILYLGILLLAALAGGQLAQMFRLPRVTAYLVVGLLLGPHVSDVLREEQLENLKLVDHLAMSLVLFNMGCHFPLALFRKLLRRIALLSTGELLLTFILVSCGMTLLGISWNIAILFGVLALATAPATTVLVLKENESEGPITEYATAMTAVNNLVALVAFEIAFLVLFSSDAASIGPGLALISQDLVYSVVLGGVIGLGVSYACGLLASKRWFVLLVAAATLTIGLCELWHIPYLLTFLTMGFTVANTSDKAKAIVKELDHFTGLLCVVFFVIHGADMDVSKWRDAGESGLALAAIGYIVFRSVGKCVGVYLAAHRGNESLIVQYWLGPTLLSQAGAAIALSHLAKERNLAVGSQLELIILGTVIFFELIGPILIRQAVFWAGEIPLNQAIRHTTTTPWEELRGLFNRVRTSLGLDPWLRRSLDDLTIGEFMRGQVKAINVADSFDEVIDFIEHSHDSAYPVINEDGRLLGLIRYDDICNAAYEPHAATLIRAADIAVPARYVIHPEQSLSDAWKLFRNNRDDCIPVVTQDENYRLVGIVRQRHLVRMFKPATETLS